MVICIICGQSTDFQHTFHSFPSDNKKKAEWWKILTGKENSNMATFKGFRICSRHFLPSAFARGNKLNRYALPLPWPMYTQRGNPPIINEVKDPSPEPVQSLPSPVAPIKPIEVESDSEPENTILIDDIRKVPAYEPEFVSVVSDENPPKAIKIRKQTTQIPAISETDTPAVKKMKRLLAHKTNQIKQLKIVCANQRAMICNLVNGGQGRRQDSVQGGAVILSAEVVTG